MMEAAWRPPARTGSRPDWMEPFAERSTWQRSTSCRALWTGSISAPRTHIVGTCSSAELPFAVWSFGDPSVNCWFNAAIFFLYRSLPNIQTSGLYRRLLVNCAFGSSGGQGMINEIRIERSDRSGEVLSAQRDN